MCLNTFPRALTGFVVQQQELREQEEQKPDIGNKIATAVLIYVHPFGRDFILFVSVPLLFLSFLPSLLLSMRECAAQGTFIS